MGPPIHVVGTSLTATGNAVAADGVIQVAFDRYLLPSTVTRQSFAILDSANHPIDTLGLRSIYDPVARTVTFTGPNGPGQAWLVADQSYKLELLVPTDPTSDLGGFRAIDRAPLAAAQEFVFRAGPAVSTDTKPFVFEPTVDFCVDVLPLFIAKCSGSQCHGTTGNNDAQSAASLLLDSASGVRVTARNRVAQGANTSSRPYFAEDPKQVFGVNMALIAPGDPGSSWLMYKLEMAKEPVLDAGLPPAIICTPPTTTSAAPVAADGYRPTASPAQLVANEEERYLLGNYILGREMPYPTTPDGYVGPGAYSVSPLTFQERERIRIWIARGAEVRECGGCGVN